MGFLLLLILPTRNQLHIPKLDTSRDELAKLHTLHEKKNPNNHSSILHSFLELVLGSEEHSQRRLSLNELEFFLSSTIYINRNELIGK